MRRKLKLEKFEIAKLKNPQYIFGGETVGSCGTGGKTENPLLCHDDDTDPPTQ